MRAPVRRRVVTGLAVVLLLVSSGAGCAAGGRPDDPTPTAPPTVTPSIPADGVTLRSLGYTNGPVQQFSLPRAAELAAAVDQTNNVTAVLSRPAPAEVAAYLRRTLPATGFTVTAEGADGTALTFTGYGWSGRFTATEGTSAVLLRPG